MAFAPYTLTYQYLPRNNNLAGGWGVAGGTPYTLLRVTGGNSTEYYAYFAPEALSPNHIAIRGVPIAPQTTLPSFVRVNDFESIPGRGLNSSFYTTGEVCYFSINLETDGIVEYWRVSFWNLHIIRNLFGGNFHIYIIRRTPSNSLTFVDGAPINSTDLNALSRQAVFVAEESDQHFVFSSTAGDVQKYDKSGGEITGNVSITGTASVAGLLTTSGGISAGNQRLTNLATPVSNSDGATKQYVDNVVGGGSTPTILSDSITSTELSKVAGSQAVSTATIQDNAVTTEKINNSGITTSKIADLAVTRSKIETNVDVNNKFLSGSIYNTNSTPLGEFNNSFNTRRPVTTDSIRTGAVTNEKLASDSVIETKIANNAVTTNKINDSAITTSKLAGGSITSEKINAGNHFNFDSDGNFNFKKVTIGNLPAVISKNVTIEQDVNNITNIKIPKATSLQVKSTTNEILNENINLNVTNGFFVNLKPQLKANPNYPGAGQPSLIIDGDLPPVPTLQPFNSSVFPPTIVVEERDETHFNGVANPATYTKLVLATFTKRKLNTITYNNTNYFSLNADGSFTFSNNNAVGWWKVNGYSSFGIYPGVYANPGRALYVSRIGGSGYNHRNGVFITTDASLLVGSFGAIDAGANDVFLTTPIEGVMYIAQSGTYRFEYYYVQSATPTSAGVIGPKWSLSGSSAPIDNTYSTPYSSLTFTKISDNTSYVF